LVELQGHRGARGHYPENTLAGFRAALAMGVTTLELDVGMTADGVVVVHHDEGLSTNGTRDDSGTWLEEPTPRLHALSWQELSRYDVGRLRPGSSYAERFPDQQPQDGERVPRLIDVVAMAEEVSGGRIRYNVETKLTPTDPEQTAPAEVFVAAVLAVLHEAGVVARSTVQSFDFRTLVHLEQTAPTLQTACLTHEETLGIGEPGPSPWTAGLDVDDFGGSIPRLVQRAGCEIWSPHHGELSDDDLADAHALGLRVIVWTVNEPEDIEAALDLGVDGIISDYPPRVREALRARNLPLPTRYPPPEASR
jgi:glycerophosphoryl diester phosphodiesterase